MIKSYVDYVYRNGYKASWIKGFPLVRLVQLFTPLFKGGRRKKRLRLNNITFVLFTRVLPV